MKKLKLFPRTFIYVTGLMLVIALLAHALIYLFLPIFYTNQKQEAITSDTDALVVLLSSHPVAEYQQVITDFRKGSMMTVMLSTQRSDGRQVWQIFNNDPEANGTEIEFYSSSSEGDFTIGTDISQNYLSVDQTFLSSENTTYALKTLLPLEPIREASGVVLLLLPITLVICVVIAAVFAWIYSKAITKPIRRLSAVAHRMEHLDPDAVCQVSGGDEIGTLAADLNNVYSNLLMTIDRLTDEMSKVSESEQSKVDFLRTASHELKTPVTAVSGMLEGMIHQVGRYKDRDTYLQECKKQIDGLNDLLRQVLESSALDMYAAARETQVVELGALMDTAIQPFELIAKTKNVNFVFDQNGSFTAELPEGLFSKAVSNVVSNAVTHTEPGKAVRIYFQGRDLIVENECTPLDDAVLARLSEPFYRPDFDHNHDTGGNGLGLYITDKVLAACGTAYTFAAMEDQTGMRFTISV